MILESPMDASFCKKHKRKFCFEVFSCTDGGSDSDDDDEEGAGSIGLIKADPDAAVRAGRLEDSLLLSCKTEQDYAKWTELLRKRCSRSQGF